MATLHLVGFITCALNNCAFCPLAECLTYLGCLLFSGRACGLIIASRSASCRPFQILRCAAESTINGSYIRKHIFYLTSPDQIEPLCPPFIMLVPLALLSSFEQINAWGHDSVGFSIFDGLVKAPTGSLGKQHWWIYAMIATSESTVGVNNIVMQTDESSSVAWRQGKRQSRKSEQWP